MSGLGHREGYQLLSQKGGEVAAKYNSQTQPKYWLRRGILWARRDEGEEELTIQLVALDWDKRQQRKELRETLREARQDKHLLQIDFPVSPSVAASQ